MLAELIEAAARSDNVAAGGAPSSGWPRRLGRAAPTGRWGSKRGHAPCSPTTRPPTPSTGRRSSASPAPDCASSWRGPTCSTGSGCVEHRVASTAESSWAPPTGCSRRWAPGRSPIRARPRAAAPPAVDARRQHVGHLAAHRAGSADRQPRARRAVEPRDRPAPVHQRPHGGVAPRQRLHEARDRRPGASSIASSATHRAPGPSDPTGAAAGRNGQRRPTATWRMIESPRAFEAGVLDPAVGGHPMDGQAAGQAAQRHEQDERE